MAWGTLPPPPHPRLEAWTLPSRRGRPSVAPVKTYLESRLGSGLGREAPGWLLKGDEKDPDVGSQP